MSGVVRRESFEDLAGCMKDYFQIDAVQLESGDFQGQGKRSTEPHYSAAAVWA
jgi:hypothetical protein